MPSSFIQLAVQLRLIRFGNISVRANITDVHLFKVWAAATAPRFFSLPRTKTGVTSMLLASFSAIESTALFCTQVTRATSAVGRRLWRIWKIVVDLPAPSKDLQGTFCHEN